MPVGLYAGYLVCRNSHKIIAYATVESLPKVVNKIINHTPPSFIRLAVKIYDYRFRICIGSFIVSCTRLNQYPLISRSLEVLSEVAYLPITIPKKILALPYEIAVVVYNQIRSATDITTHFVKEKRGIFQALRISQNLQNAETLFVNQVMSLKAK